MTKFILQHTTRFETTKYLFVRDKKFIVSIITRFKELAPWSYCDMMGIWQNLTFKYL